MRPQRLHAALAGNAASAFAPWLWELAADRAAVSIEELASSPGKLVVALCDAAKLVEADAVCVLVDAEDTPAFEAMARLAAMSLSIDVTAVAPGPRRLGEIRGIDDPDECEDLAEDLVRAVLVAGCSVLAVDEPDPDPDRLGPWRAMTRLADFYGARRLVLSKASSAFLLDVGFDALDDGRGRAGDNVVTSAWSPRPGGADADALRATARALRDGRVA